MPNILLNAKTIDNSFLCKYDNIDGYSSDFSSNGDVSGWDTYYNTYLYGSWGGVLFGTSYSNELYIGNTSTFSSLDSEEFYYIKLKMKLTNGSDKSGLTTGMITWTTTSDDEWNTSKSTTFDIYNDDEWHEYTINMGPCTYWVGYISSIRIYPFIDGHEKDSFAIKYIKVSSLNTYTCSNKQCDYYNNYSHPCLGAGIRGSCTSTLSKTSYTLTSSNRNLPINIDNYGEANFDLGEHFNLSGDELAKLLNLNLVFYL